MASLGHNELKLKSSEISFFHTINFSCAIVLNTSGQMCNKPTIFRGIRAWDVFRGDIYISTAPGPVLLLWPDAVARRLANDSVAFIWKWCRNWLRGLRQRQIAVARQVPAGLFFNKTGGLKMWPALSQCLFRRHICSCCVFIITTESVIMSGASLHMLWMSSSLMYGILIYGYFIQIPLSTVKMPVHIQIYTE